MNYLYVAILIVVIIIVVWYYYHRNDGDDDNKESFDFDVPERCVPHEWYYRHTRNGKTVTEGPFIGCAQTTPGGDFWCPYYAGSGYTGNKFIYTSGQGTWTTCKDNDKTHLDNR